MALRLSGLRLRHTGFLQSDSEAISQHSYGVKQEAVSQSNWRHNKAANEGIPGSLHK